MISGGNATQGLCTPQGPLLVSSSKFQMIQIGKAVKMKHCYPLSKKHKMATEELAMLVK